VHRIFISFAAKWARQDSNLRPTGYEPAALPLSYEPALPPMESFICRGNRVWWSGRRDSNPRHPAWKAGTLPLSYSRETESILPQILVGKQEKVKLLDNLILRSLDKSGQRVSRPTTKQILCPQNRCHKRRLTEGCPTYSLWCSRR
jgi:hypothetical protein